MPQQPITTAGYHRSCTALTPSSVALAPYRYALAPHHNASRPAPPLACRRDIQLDITDWREGEDSLTTKWRFSAILDLPWRPRLAAAGGTTHVFDTARKGWGRCRRWRQCEGRGSVPAQRQQAVVQRQAGLHPGRSSGRAAAAPMGDGSVHEHGQHHVKGLRLPSLLLRRGERWVALTFPSALLLLLLL